MGVHLGNAQQTNKQTSIFTAYEQMSVLVIYIPNPNITSSHLIMGACILAPNINNYKILENVHFNNLYILQKIYKNVHLQGFKIPI